MREGDKLCFDIEQTKPDFGNSLRVDGTFDPDVFFDYQAMTQEANYMPYVREDENHGIGGLNPGYGYTRAPDFCMIIRSSAETEEELQEQISRIPRFETDFTPIIIQ